MKNIEGFDLNLLVVFDALMRTKNVTRAAERIGLAQPSVSNALARLRGVLGDELFLRTPQGMQPTAMARRIAPQVKVALEAARAAINDATEFDPATAEVEIRLATTDYSEFVLLPALMRALEAQAPGAALRLLPFDRERVGPQLDAGEIDLAIGVPGSVAAHHAARVLFAEDFACIRRADGAEGIDLETFLERPHALATRRGDATDAVDRALAEIGEARAVVLSTPSFIGLPFLVADTDLVAVVPRRLALRAAEMAPVAVADVPVALPGFRLTMLWPRAQAGAPHLRWMRALIGEVAREVATGGLELAEGEDEDLWA